MQPTASTTNTVAKTATPIVDVMLPAKTVASNNGVVEAPLDQDNPFVAEQPKKDQKTVAKQAKKSPVTMPVLAIGLALLFFIILSGLAYYAYANK